MNKGLATLEDIENKLSIAIADIRKSFPDGSNYTYSIDNPIANSLGLTIEEQADIGVDGYISGKTIVINNDITYQERKNFSLFHEISHYLIKNDDEINSFLMEFHAGKEDEYQRYIEFLCNSGAGEFLAPIGKIREIIAEKKYSITLLKDIDKIFPVSKPALLFQLARAASHKCTLVVIERGPLQRGTEQQHAELKSVPTSGNQYYILYSATSKRNKYRPGRFAIIPKHHLLRNAFEEQRYLKGKDFIPYKSGNKDHKIDCEAMYYHGKVYGLFNLEPPPNDHLQSRLFED